MIVCHCNVITDVDIRSAVADLLDADPHRLLTPGVVYATLGKRGKCCGCFPNAIDVIRRAAEAYGGRLVEEAPVAAGRCAA